jgi:hypothetical protein
MFSIIAPIDTNRLEQFKRSKEVYDTMPQTKEFLMPTRSFEEVHEYFVKNRMMRDVKLIPYTHEIGFNPAKALNIGVREANYDQIIITSPEVKPAADVLDKLQECIGQNVICEVAQEKDPDGDLEVLVTDGYRSETPAMYFLAMFNKKDIEVINGWDEDFMKGYAFEDNDFGDRWVRAKLPFIVRSDIRATHLWHPRAETIPGGLSVNEAKYKWNNEHGIIECKNGLKVV